MATLGSLVAAVPSGLVERIEGDPATPITGVVLDSRHAGPGTLFAALPGSRVDGHDHAPAAVAAGAAALLVERALPLSVPQVVVRDARAALGPVASSLFGDPSHQVPVCGITGTNGKTTTTHLLAAVLEHAGVPTGSLGTLTGRFTTPEAPELQSELARFVAEGRQAVVMEVSSHALALHRTDGTRFRVGAFTNLGRDHLDFHGTVERYFAAKARLFEPGAAERAVVWVDDPHGRLLADAIEIPCTEVRMADAAGLELDAGGARFTWRGHAVALPLAGRHNVANALVAAACAAELGIAPERVAAGLSAAPAVPGRLEPVEAGQEFRVLVDFAHTPEGLVQVLGNLREAAGAVRLVLVFGCGGDRDAEKRPAMGAVAAAGADVVVVTSDNPRSEDPDEIIRQVVAGIPGDARAKVLVEPDRRRAIGLALGAARPGDIVVLAGKGHETTQTVAGEVRPFDDRVVARELLEARR